jgi:hypothetical protein
VSRTPYDGGPLQDETLPLVDMLLSLNSKGLFSTGSQPSVDLYATENTALGLRHDQQKSFVDGFIDKGYHSERIIRRLQQLQPDFFMSAVDMATDATLSNFPRRICVTRASKCVEGEARWEEYTWHGGSANGFREAIELYDSSCKRVFAGCYGLTLCSSAYGGGCAVEKLLEVMEEEARH